MKYDKENREIPDKTPVEMPLGYKHPEPLADLIKRLCHNELYQQALKAEGNETFEEADDFEVEEEEEIRMPGHEFTEMTEENLRLKAEEEADEYVSKIVQQRGTQPPVGTPPPTNAPKMEAKTVIAT